MGLNQRKRFSLQKEKADDTKQNYTKKNHNDIDIITTFILFLIAAPAISVPCLKLRDFAEGMNLLEEVIQRVWDIIVEKEIVEGDKIKEY